MSAADAKTTIRRENDTFYVEGEWLFNLMGQINFSDYESLNFFQKVLRRSGVFLTSLKHAAVLTAAPYRYTISNLNT